MPNKRVVVVTNCSVHPFHCVRPTIVAPKSEGGNTAVNRGVNGGGWGDASPNILAGGMEMQCLSSPQSPESVAERMID